MVSMFSLTARVALVTGGGRGVGKAITLGFAEANADVVVAARTAEIEKTSEEIRAVGRSALARACDVTEAT
jgi:7-alpha-hydroxysteroid dehydrogenase